MDINSEAKKWSNENTDKTLEQAFVAGFIKHGEFAEGVRLKKEEKIKAMEKEFYNSLIPYVAEFGRELVREFYEHWKQPNQSRTKLGWQIEKKWDLEARLNTFRRNNDKWASKVVSQPKKDEVPVKKYREIN